MRYTAPTYLGLIDANVEFDDCECVHMLKFRCETCKKTYRMENWYIRTAERLYLEDEEE